jgi:phosphatidylethanolamine/phosphatidyl-N-methylethanolamine N-methyltransferase
MTTTALAPAPRKHGVRFLKEFITQPFVIGAIAPSSKRLARKMVEGVNFARAKAIVEFGPGTGAFTDKILRRLSPDCRYFAIELNPTMAELWRSRHPGRTLYLDSVKNVDRLCRDEGIDQVDVVFSGLPWASFDDQLQEETLAATLRVLRPGGQLITFGYRVGTMLPKGRRFYRRLPKFFAAVERSEYVWRNLPPAFVVRCTK